ncbi:hypothetical protein [Halococcoides cellulosivorans]|uniref:Uncharacterized protein n=1 Tax=Halococcoides cellulosivorans TaxID=1679096 RepID=A0A2R4X1I5_9EURY|nr:hypothetical protein [Halococcoides cellulosivorans]AWB27650.1 hypothetical protein HARCEL1_07975 [Halococcoides cellulosivorans]
MLRSVLSRLPFVQGADQEASDDDSAGYLPSQLDASVLFAHGLGTEEVEAAESRAEELEAVHDR